MRFLSALFAMLCLSGLTYAQKDTLLFKNGTMILGEVKKIQLGVITFDPDDANDITVQLRKLHSMHASGRDFRVETVDHQVLFGRLINSTGPGLVNLVSGTDTTNLLLNNISNLYPVENNFWERLRGTAGAGFSYTRSSDLGRLNLDFSVRYTTRQTEFKVSFSGISTVENGYFSRDNADGMVSANYYFHNKWYGYTTLKYQRNIEIGINSRYQEGAGIGNKLFTTQYLRLLAFSGFVINQEYSTENVYSGILTEYLLGCQFNIFRFEKPELDIETSQYGYFSLSQERIRYSGDISVTWEMVEDLDLKISFYTDYDSKPPGEGSANADYGTVISIAYEF